MNFKSKVSILLRVSMGDSHKPGIDFELPIQTNFVVLIFVSKSAFSTLSMSAFYCSNICYTSSQPESQAQPNSRKFIWKVPFCDKLYKLIENEITKIIKNYNILMWFCDHQSWGFCRLQIAVNNSQTFGIIEIVSIEWCFKT